MLVMAINESKLQRIIDAADGAYAELRHCGDRLSDVRQQVAGMRVKLERDRAHYRGQVNAETVRALSLAEAERERLQTQHDRLSQRWSERKMVADNLEAWAKEHAHRRRAGDDSVLMVRG